MDKKFEDLIDSFERNISSSAYFAASSTLVKILRLMWEEIRRNKAE
jgi:hypothetical protein